MYHENVPSGQTSHTLCPSLPTYWPGKQDLHHQGCQGKKGNYSRDSRRRQACIKALRVDRVQTGMYPLNKLAFLLVLSSAVFARGGLAPSFKPTTPLPTTLDPDDVVRFTKTLYKELGNNWGNTTTVTDKFRDRFRDLNETTEGQLGQTLAALFEIRMLDLQASVRHARKMRTVIEAFSSEPPAQG